MRPNQELNRRVCREIFDCEEPTYACVPDDYAASWEKAGQVIDAMERDGFRLYSIKLMPNGVLGAAFVHPDDEPPAWFSPAHFTGVTGPESVCMAALFAKQSRARG